MKLKAYFKTQKIKQYQFAQELGIHYMYLSNIVRGKRRPSPDLADKIEQATGGAVTLRELLFPEKSA